MSGTYNLEEALRSLSEELGAESMRLLDTADLLKNIRDHTERREAIDALKGKVKEYLK